jgi:Ca2+-binding RTX toxin-like protein
MFDGGGGNDFFEDDGFRSTDAIKGGTGIDQVSYERATGAVVADIDNVADDGQPGENDMIRSDVENLYGSEFGDILVGTSFPGLENTANLIQGGGGIDYIEGLGGADSLHGDAGDDHIAGQDGADVMSGGYGSDWLWGGDGWDSADGTYGDNGFDTCSTEVTMNCDAISPDAITDDGP